VTRSCPVSLCVFRKCFTDKTLVDFEMDLYWVVRAGHDPLQLFKEHPGRFKMWHVKIWIK
jgi:hypothetical protein